MVFKLEKLLGNKSKVTEDICFFRMDYLKMKSQDKPINSFETYGCQTCSGHNEYCAKYFPTTVQYTMVHNSKPHEDSIRRKPNNMNY